MTNDQENKKNDGWTKLMFGVLIFFGIATLFLGILKINRSISSQVFPSDVTNVGQSQDDVNNSQTIEELMVTDTDGDGLSDYQEIYIYNTSIYLADTDSDNYSDKEEVDGGYDPNCPNGMDCRGTSETSEVTDSSSSNNNIDTTTDNTLDQLSAEEKAQLKNLTASELRQLLVDSGEVTEEELSQISDEDLMAAFGEMLGQ